MPAGTFTAIPSFEMIGSGKNYDSLIGVVVVPVVKPGVFSFHSGSEGVLFLLKSVVHEFGMQI